MCHYYAPQRVWLCSKLNVYLTNLALLGLEVHYELFSSCQYVVAACMSGYGGLVHGGYVSGFGGALVAWCGWCMSCTPLMTIGMEAKKVYYPMGTSILPPFSSVLPM